MKADYFRTLFDYNYWAHAKVWTCVERLPEDLFVRKMDYSEGSIRAELLYTMSVEWAWLARMRGKSPNRLFTAKDLPTRAAIHAKWSEIEQDVKGYVASLKDSELDEIVHYQTIGGMSFSNPKWEMLMHLIVHGVDRRGKTLAMLYRLEQPTVTQDFITYIRESRGLIPPSS